jgi:mxaA protein
MDAAIRQLDVANPRSFGYVIGDVIKRRIRLDLEGQYRLDPDSFPHAGRINRWLEMRQLELYSEPESEGMVYELTIVYQIMDAPQEPTQLSIPEITLRYGEGGHPLTLLIPSWRFTVTPLISGKGEQNSIYIDLQPDRAPPLIRPEARIARAILMGIIMAAAVLVLLYMLAGIPFLNRSRGPFALAYRQLKRYRRKPYDEAYYLDALRCVHQAFNLTAGRVLFVNQIDIFFTEKPAFSSLRSRIERFYAHSRSVFYDAANKSEKPDYSMDCLLNLCRSCRDVERGLS